MPVRKRKNEVVTIEGQHGRQDNPFTARRSIRRVGVALLVLVGGGGAVGTPLVGQDPPAVLTGRVFDQAGPVLAADVSLLRGTEVVARAVSDDRGAFRIEAPAGGFTLKAERLGYAALSRLVTLQPGVVTDVDIELQPAAVLIEGVGVEAVRSRERLRFEETAGASVRELRSDDLRRVPGIGEADPIRAIEVLPGVVSTSDFSSAFHVRGGSADQNLILLDCTPIFSPFHLC